jgi:hypothetical protein
MSACVPCRRNRAPKLDHAVADHDIGHGSPGLPAAFGQDLLADGGVVADRVFASGARLTSACIISRA